MSATNQTKMQHEAAEAPERVAAMLDANREGMKALAARFAKSPPRLIMTCARGSSDHAATYLQYACHIHLGIPVLSLPPSIASIYKREMNLEGVLFVVISQSGKSPDLVAGAQWAKAHGATVVAFVNVEDSPVAHAADLVFGLHAGPEISVAATKSFLTALAAGAQLVGAFSTDADFIRAVDGLPEALSAARDLDWSAAVAPLAETQNAYVVGRGTGFAAASEMALKLKETSAMHAEAFSAAEILHGPLGLLKGAMPVLIVGQNDATHAGAVALAKDLRAKGAHVLCAFEGAEGAGVLPVVPGLHPAIAPLAAVQSFYRMAAGLSVKRGFNPDQPEHLKKVTETH